MTLAIEIKDLTRKYEVTKGILHKRKSKISALKGIDFDVKKGEIFGLLGPNGAGKTTTIKILATLLAPTSGQAKVLGYDTFKDSKKLRPKINFIFGGERSLYWRLSARDNLLYFSDLYKIDRKIQKKRIPELLEMVGIKDRADEKVETYSKGMKQRLQIARGLVNDPEIIFLDEPTIGLDPIGARDLRKIINKLSSLGKTILLTTHYMHEAEELCNRVAIINNGKIIALDTPEGLKRLTVGKSVLEVKVLSVDDQKMEKMKKINDIESINVRNEQQFQIIQLQYSGKEDITERVIKILEGCMILNVLTRVATLEDAYIKLVGDEK
ncbi:ABC transporter ATP-binding protein [Abyssisolibacter fermentans]|uniref:ABC transporter ATP-binding protein n=1 Tax=Abyssisolibacter fermentans TaxID=1766203 RepID=UPI0008376BE2|nr:ABC transporter ATP-binding protein [Abyssisolibacter fermentans]